MRKWEKFYLRDGLRLDLNIRHQKLQLQTNSKQLGLFEEQPVKKFQLHQTPVQEHYRVDTDDYATLVINFMLDEHHQDVDRDYYTFMDAVAYFGGLRESAS